MAGCAGPRLSWWLVPPLLTIAAVYGHASWCWRKSIRKEMAKTVRYNDEPSIDDFRHNARRTLMTTTLFVLLAACDFTRLPENSAAQRAGFAVCNAVYDAGCGEHPWCFDGLSGPCPWSTYITPPPPTPEPVCRERCRRYEGESALCYTDVSFGRIWSVNSARVVGDPDPLCVEWGDPLPCGVSP